MSLPVVYIITRPDGSCVSDEQATREELIEALRDTYRHLQNERAGHAATLRLLKLLDDLGKP